MATQTMISTQNRTVMGVVVAAVLASIGNLLVYFIAGASNVVLAVPLPPDNALMPIPFFMVIVASVMPTIGAGVLLWGLKRFSPRGRTIFTVIAIGFLLLSFIPLIAMPQEVATATRLALGAMHLVAGVVITGVLLYFDAPKK
jgi:hypothetical protein